MTPRSFQLYSASTQNATKKAVINVQNNAFTPHRVSKYRNLEHRYNFDCIHYLTPLQQIKTFEKYNNSINVFAVGESVDVYPLKVVRQEKPQHWDLLLSDDNGRSHYTYIKDFNNRRFLLIRVENTFVTDVSPISIKMVTMKGILQNPNIFLIV